MSSKQCKSLVWFLSFAMIVSYESMKAMRPLHSPAHHDGESSEQTVPPPPRFHISSYSLSSSNEQSNELPNVSNDTVSPSVFVHPHVQLTINLHNLNDEAINTQLRTMTTSHGSTLPQNQNSPFDSPFTEFRRYARDRQLAFGSMQYNNNEPIVHEQPNISPPNIVSNAQSPNNYNINDTSPKQLKHRRIITPLPFRSRSVSPAASIASKHSIVMDAIEDTIVQNECCIMFGGLFECNRRKLCVMGVFLLFCIGFIVFVTTSGQVDQ